MIICSCRNISDQDYDTDAELLHRLLQHDKECCMCIKLVSQRIKRKKEFIIPKEAA